MTPRSMMLAICLAACHVLIASPSDGFELEIAAPGETLAGESPLVASSPDTLIALFKLTGILDEGSSVGDGIPATLLLVVDLWRDRDGWWDSLVRSQTFTYQFRRDIWTGEVDLWNLDRSQSRLADRETLLGYLERVHEVVLGLPENFESEKSYYITVKAMIQPMNMDDLESVDAWFSGRVSESGGGGFLGIPKALARIVVDVSGLGDQSTMAKSRPFVPRP